MPAGLKGHNITCDHFFTSYAFGQELLLKKLTMVGTIRWNKPELPPALLVTQDWDNFCSRFTFTDTHTVVSYCPKKRKNVLLITSLHRGGTVSTREDKKPNAILDYNRMNKGGVDNLDKVCWFLFFNTFPERQPLQDWWERYKAAEEDHLLQEREVTKGRGAVCVHQEMSKQE